MKKLILIIMSILIFNIATVSAAQIQIVGHGETEQSAIHNAMRLAIEREIGIYVDSKTRVLNRKVISTEIYANSQGFIESYEILRTSIINGIYEVEINANVRSNELQSSLNDIVKKKSLIETNLNNPRIAAVAVDSYGQQYPDVENEIISALQKQGFSRIIDLNQLDASIKMRLKNADNDTALRNSIKNQFHVDYIVAVQVKTAQLKNKCTANLAVRMIGVNTGEIIYAGSFNGNSRMFTNNTIEGALNSAVKRAAPAVASAALNKAAQIEQHITILATKKTSDFIERIKNIQGVNKVFVRSINGNNAELDVNFDGTAYELAAALERINIPVIELHSDFIKV